MRDYQQAAVELGFLHYRYLRGTPPPDFAARGQEYVARIARGASLRSPSPDRWCPHDEPDRRGRVADSTQMLTALVRLRGALQDGRAAARVPGRRRAARHPARDGRPARGLRHPAR